MSILDTGIGTGRANESSATTDISLRQRGQKYLARLALTLCAERATLITERN